MAWLTFLSPHPFQPLAALFLMLGLVGPAAAEQLVAIDVLLQPDRTMLAAAEDWNTRLREQMPGGFALDPTHVPHITLLQTYVAEAELDTALAAVARSAEKLNVAALQLEAVGLYHIPIKEQGLAGIVIGPTPALLAVQQAIIDALGPYRRQGGDQAAFVPDPMGTPFDPSSSPTWIALSPCKRTGTTIPTSPPASARWPGSKLGRPNPSSNSASA